MAVRVFDVFRRVLKGRSAGSTSRDAVHEDDCQRLNAVKPKALSSSIFELYSPSATDTIALDIFFFHGLQQENTPDAHVSTWRSKPGEDQSEVIWPQAWLPAKYPQARIMTVSYDASIKTTDTEGRMDLHLIGEALLVEILQVRQANSHPLILVGHSFGGLVIKQLCTHAFKLSNADLDESFLRCIKGILFYGTPHLGMDIPHSWVDSFREARNEPLLKFVDQLSREAARVHAEFEENWGSYGWKIYTVNETHAPSEGKQLVPEASSRSESSNIFVSSDHYSTCRPASQECTKYLHLCKLIGSVVDEIQTRKDVLQDFSSGLVLDENSKEELLERVKGHFQKQMFFGFAGMAGSGKTAVAKFVGTHFASVLGSELLFLAPVPQNYAEFVAEVKASLSCHRKKLLVILDDIPDLDHMHADELRQLAVECGPERIRFIGTSRDMGRFRKLWWPKYAEIWNVPLLKFKAAKKLFSSKAFPLGRIPPDHLKELIDEVVEGCAGLPLCLETAGGYLEGRKNVSIWKEIARALREADDESGGPLDGVWKQLKASLDSLHEEEKEMFLDVAYLLWSADSRFSFDDFETTWISTYKLAAIKWRTLLDRFLVQKVEVKKKVEPEVLGPWEATELASVSVPETTKIQVHDHLKAIGKKIALKLRLDVEIPPGGRPAVGGTIHLAEIVALRSSSKVQSDGSSFEAPVERVKDNPCCDKQILHTTLESVRYLRLKVPPVCGRCKAEGGMRLPTGLRMLQWRGSTSNIIKLDQRPSFWQTLVVLKLKRDDNCCLDILSPAMFRNLSNLQRLSLESKDMALPGLAELRELRYLEIQCELLGSLPDFGSLRKLKFLCLKECSEFKTWDDGMDFKSLSSLETLMLECCVKLRTLPSQFPPGLKHLSVTHCHSLRSLPPGIGELANFETLNLDSCIRLENLPESFGRLSSLMRLSLAHCMNLRSLPDTFGGLSNLQTLSLSHCKKLEYLPESFGELSRLSVLQLDYCKRLHTLGQNFWHLPSLKFLNLNFCDNLPPVPGLKISRRGQVDRDLCSLDRVYAIKEVPESFVSLQSRKRLVGVEPRLKEAELHLQEKVFLGLVGRGGIGKTALARHVFEAICDTFEYTCFVEELRRGHPKEIRFQVEKNMHHGGKLISRSEKMYSDLWTEMIGKKLLLVCDDVSQVQQIELMQEIAAENDCVESRFIATGRDEQLLRCLDRIPTISVSNANPCLGAVKANLERVHILRVDPLPFEDARKLFMIHAYPGEGEPPEHPDLDNVVHECDGLPLTLKIMGGYLRNVNREDKWKNSLSCLQKANASFFLEERLWAVFRLSFDVLEVEEKQMFLDVACFLLREDCPFSFEEVRSAWSLIYIRAAETWQTLLDRSLVAEQETRLVVYNQESTQRLADAAGGSTSLTDNASEEKITEVHMQKDLRAFGERVAEEMGRYYLLHNVPPGSAFTVDTGRLEGTVALRVNIGDLGFLETPGKDEGDLHRYSRCREVQENFEYLKAIRYLELRVPWHVPCMLCKTTGGIHLPSGLRILHWSGYNINIQLSFEAVRSLAVLKLSRKDECCRDILSPKVCRYLTNLERLELASNDCRLPDEFGELWRLQHLEIHCEILSMLPESFGCLTWLRCLRLHHCKQLRTLPESFGELSCLKILTLDSCIQFESFSKSFVYLSALVDLSLNECMNLRYLPEDFGYLYHLRRLSLDHCGSLETLPESFGKLTLLESLSLDYCWELKCLPESFGELPRLQTLSLGYCLELQELPGSLGNLSALELLNLDHCTELRLLPSNFGNLSGLRRLNLEFCPKLLTLPETFWDLSRLERLSVRCSPQLEPYLEKSGVYPFWKNSD